VTRFGLEDGSFFELLCWKAPKEGMEIARVSSKAEIPPSILPGGWESSGVPLQVAVANDGGETLVGKFNPTNGGSNFPKGEKEMGLKEFEVLFVQNGTALKDSQCMLAETPFLPKNREFLISVNELLKWEFSPECHVAGKSLKEAKHLEKASNQKILHCHDMMGGYCKGPDSDYLEAFGGWEFIDVFVYFSHNRVGIPPRAWIEACHERNTACLGTIITEHKVGTKENLILLSKSDACVEKLAEIAQRLGFEGYLVNIESPTHDREGMRDFVEKLTNKMREVVGPSSLVICYDSLDKKGNIRYFNALVEDNLDLFEVSDAFFTNYWWSIEETRESAKLAQKNGRPAADIYVGVDIFARMNVRKLKSIKYKPGPGANIAVKAAWEAGCSIALFAPGWSLENGPAKSGATLGEKQKRDKEFWSELLKGT